jgi:hypothetical protein
MNFVGYYELQIYFENLHEIVGEKYYQVLLDFVSTSINNIREFQNKCHIEHNFNNIYGYA